MSGLEALTMLLPFLLVTAVSTSSADPTVAWPPGKGPVEADVFNHNALVIGSKCEAIYPVLADASAWPSSLPFVRGVHVEDGKPLHMDSRFRWNVLGHDVVSRIFVAEPGVRLGWINQPSGYVQSWSFVPADSDHCKVTVEEVGFGPSARETTRRHDPLVGAAHDLWLASIRLAALQRQKTSHPDVHP